MRLIDLCRILASAFEGFDLQVRLASLGSRIIESVSAGKGSEGAERTLLLIAATVLEGGP